MTIASIGNKLNLNAYDGQATGLIHNDSNYYFTFISRRDIIKFCNRYSNYGIPKTTMSGAYFYLL